MRKLGDVCTLENGNCELHLYVFVEKASNRRLLYAALNFSDKQKIRSCTPDSSRVMDSELLFNIKHYKKLERLFK